MSNDRVIVVVVVSTQFSASGIMHKYIATSVHVLIYTASIHCVYNVQQTTHCSSLLSQ
jgi:hypothetical protein